MNQITVKTFLNHGDRVSSTTSHPEQIGGKRSETAVRPAESAEIVQSAKYSQAVRPREPIQLEKSARICVRELRMQYLTRTVLSAALMTMPLTATGCSTVPVHSRIPTPQSSQMAGLRHYQKLEAAKREENRGHLEEARRLYTVIHNEEPKNAECCHRLALVYSKLNRHNDAEVYFHQAAEITPDNPRLLADRGYSSFLRKDYDQAEIWLEQSLRLDPHNHISINDSSTVLNLAIVQAWMSKDDSSLATFRMITDEAESRRNLAAIQIARGDKNLGLQNYELAQNLEQTPPALATTAVETPRLLNETVTNHETAISYSEELPAVDLASVPIPDVPAATDDVVPAPTNLVAITQPTYDGSLNGQNEIVLAPLAKSSDTNTVLVSTCVRPWVGVVSCPISVTVIESDSPFELVETDSTSETTSIRPSAETTEEIVFELPVKRVLEEAVTVEAQVSKVPVEIETPREVLEAVPWDEDQPIRLDELTTGQDLSEFCMVSLRENRRLVKGQREFSVEHHGLKYLFSSAEARQKFQNEPERYTPSAGGLDLVQFRNEREVVRGSLKYATWYRRCLYVFSTQKNREIFQQSPESYVVTQVKSAESEQ